MEQKLEKLYGLEYTRSAIVEFNKSLKADTESSGNVFNQILMDVVEICQGDFDSVSELSSQVSKVVSNMYEFNDTLIFNDPLKNHIPVLTALVKSIMCSELGDFSIEVQKNEKSAAQLYGLALDHLLQGKAILSFLNMDSALFNTFEPEIINKFMDSYTEFKGIVNAHSIITLKYYLMTESEKTADWYSSDLLTSIGHGFYSILSSLNEMSPQNDWIPFTNRYFSEKCVEVHEKALKFDMDKGHDSRNSANYYVQSAKLDLGEQELSNEKLFKIFSDYGLYELAANAAKSVEEKFGDIWKNVQNISGQRSLGEHIDAFNERYDSLIKDFKKNSNIFSGCSILLSEIMRGNYQNIGKIENDQFIHNIFCDLFKTIPDTKNDADRAMMLGLLIDSLSSVYRFEEENFLANVLVGIRNKNKLGSTEKDINKLLDNAKNLKAMGLNLFETDGDKEAPDIKSLSVFKGYYFDLLKQILDKRVAYLQFLLELSKTLEHEYDRRELVTFRAIRSLLSINDKKELIDTVFSGTSDYIPIALTLRFKMLETISKAIYQLSPYKGSSITVDVLLSRLKELESENIVFGARDEAQVYEYSESSRVLTKVISEVLSSTTSGKSKPIIEHDGYSFVDSNYGWDNLLDRAESFNKAAIIHHHASTILKESGNAAMASQAREHSRECEGRAYLLAAFYYESKRNMSQKADDMYTKAITAFMDAKIKDVAEAITARKFWFREQSHSHSDVQ